MTLSYLDLTALGRQEDWEESAQGYPQAPPYQWWNWHDNYGAEARPDPTWVTVSDAGEAAFRNRDAAAKQREGASSDTKRELGTRRG